MKPSEQLRELVRKWKNSKAHTHASENADHYRGFDAGQLRAAESLESLIPAVEQLEYVQRERDAVIRGHLYDILNHTRMDIDASNAIREVIQKLGGAE